MIIFLLVTSFSYFNIVNKNIKDAVFLNLLLLGNGEEADIVS